MARERWILGLACAAALVAGAPTDIAGQIGREEVVSVEFTGNSAFTDSELQRAILSEATSCPFILAITTCALGIDWGRDVFFYSPRTVALDLLRLTELYRAHGFREVVVDTVVSHHEDATVSVEFDIAEGDPFLVASIGFEGDSVPSELGLGRDLPLRPGDPLSFLLMEETQDTITQRLWNRRAQRIHGHIAGLLHGPRTEPDSELPLLLTLGQLLTPSEVSLRN